MSKFIDTAPNNHRQFAIDFVKYHNLIKPAKKLFADELLTLEEFSEIETEYDKLLAYSDLHKIFTRTNGRFEFNGWPITDD
jgi:hypothetical protein